MLSPLLEVVSKRFAHQLHFTRVNTEEQPQVSQNFDITTIPAVKLFVLGEVYDGFEGAKPEYAIDQWIRRALPNRFSSDLEAARQLLDSGENSNAQRVLMDVLSQDPDNADARVLMAMSFLYSDPVQADRFAGGLGKESSQYDQAIAIRILARLLRKPPPPAETRDQPVVSRYHEGIEALRRRDLEQALTPFLAVYEMDREHDNDGARKACIAICRLLGESHPRARETRRKLSGNSGPVR
jgi:putative thioredoxin